MHSSLVATLASAAKFSANETVHPSMRAMQLKPTVATESKLSALTSAQPLYAQFPLSVLAFGT